METNIDPRLKADLDDAIANGFMQTIYVQDDFYSFRHPEYPINSCSKNSGRFGVQGTSAYYTASGSGTACAEVHDHREKTLCRLKEGPVNAFPIHRFAAEYGYGSQFIGSKEDDGWSICQSVGQYLTTVHGVSGLLYQSQKQAVQGVFGLNLVIIPRDPDWVGELFDEFMPKTSSLEAAWRMN